MSDQAALTKVGAFEVLAQVGEGGMATIHLAHKPGGPLLALKLIRPNVAEDWQATRWFIDEALVSIDVEHPNVVRVHELDEDAGRYFLCMEYVHGCTLAELLATLGRKGQKLPPEVTAYIVGSVCRGLHAAHETTSEIGDNQGIVHRDVSPQNILLSHLGEVKITDFGIADAGGRAVRTAQGDFRGKVRYLAPEQVRGTLCDHRTDVYAAGVVLWETLTQSRLYKKDMDHNTLIQSVADSIIPPPSTRRPGLPPDFDAIVEQATARDLEHRFQNADAMARALFGCAGENGAAGLMAVMDRAVGEALLSRSEKLPPAAQEALNIGPLRERVGILVAEKKRASEARREKRSTPKTAPTSVKKLLLMAALFVAAIIGLGVFGYYVL